MLLTPHSFPWMSALRYLPGASNVECPELNSIPSASDLLLPCVDQAQGQVHTHPAVQAPGTVPIHHHPHHCPSGSPADVSQGRPSPYICTSTAIVQASIKFHKFHRGSLSAHILQSVLPTTANLILSHFCFEKKKIMQLLQSCPEDKVA